LKRKHYWLGLLVLLLAACATYTEYTFEQRFGAAAPVDRLVANLPPQQVDYWAEVKPVLESRCVVCHGCYDAPCQLKLGAIEGIERGASEAVVYDQSRLRGAEPTRLFEDAQTVSEWRAKGFYPVLNEHRDSIEANREASVMYRMLALKGDNPLPAEKLLGDKFDLDINRKNVCAAPAAFDKYAADHPLFGMPYALPALDSGQQATLMQWLEQGARYTARPALASHFADSVATWETFFNEPSLKSQLAARYIYEHLFLTHMYFPSLDNRTFFRLVRSSSPPGEPLDIIATRRPYDEPGHERVYYRLMPELESVVAKTHMPYALTPERMSNWQAWFKDSSYEVSKLPSYDLADASNPFRTFDAIPVRSRYRFLLDEAHNTINSFIKGPVCRGQVAVDVINDRFWVFFADPDDSKLNLMEGFIEKRFENDELPASSGNIYAPITHWRRYSKQQKRLIAAWDEYLSEHYDDPQDISLDLVWDGDGVNDNAALTVFRHFNSATVEKGLIGTQPKTAWLVDYTLLERIHYLLVAGYDVFGNVGHQLFTRTYMDFLRMEGEASFLLLLPEEARQRERAYWYREAADDVQEFMALPRFESTVTPAIDYKTNDEKAELLSMLQSRLAAVLPDDRSLASLNNSEIAGAFETLEQLQGGPVIYLPQVAFVEIKGASASQYLSIVRNDAHLNITALFKEDKYRVPAEDTVTVVAGFLGAYPNAFWSVPETRLKEFVEALSSLKSDADYERFVDSFGVRRTDPAFWQYADTVHSRYLADAPVEFGLFDFGRLEDR
jgi:hypothetical protein